MTPEQDRIIKESHANSIEALRLAQENSLFWFGKPEDREKINRPPNRAERFDGILLRIDASKLGYRFIMGFAAFCIAVGGALTIFKGWK